jgi:HK97 family phage major capsid protein
MNGHAINETGLAALRRAQAALRLVKPDGGDLSNYSLVRAMQYAMTEPENPDPDNDDRALCYEALLGQEYERAGFKRKLRRSIFVPQQVILRNIDRTGMRTQAFQTLITGSGAELVETEFRADLLIDALRPRSVALQLGAVPVGELIGDVEIPRQDTTSSAFWLAQGTGSMAITESEGTFDSTPLTAKPCVVGAISRISRNLLMQAKSRLAESIVSTDLVRTLGGGLDAAVFQGSGAGGQPTGIVNVNGVNAMSGASFALATAISAQAGIANANAIVSRRALGWAAPSATAALLMQRFAVPTYSYSPIWSGGIDAGEVLGWPALSSNNLPAGTAVCGDFSQVLVLSWGENAPIEIEVNPYDSTGFATGDVAIRAMLSANVVVRHPASFSVVSGVT